MIKMGVIIRRVYCITKLIVDAWKNFKITKGLINKKRFLFFGSLN
jgi:hypothetical protein